MKEIKKERKKERKKGRWREGGKDGRPPVLGSLNASTVKWGNLNFGVT